MQSKMQVLLEDNVWLGKYNKISSEIEYLKVLKVAFALVSVKWKSLERNNWSTLFNFNIQKERTWK